MKKRLLFKDYLDCIFTSQQQKILAYCVKNNINVCLYGTGLGKSLTAGIFRNAGYNNVFAPEDCTDLKEGALSIPNETGSIALCIKKESHEITISARLLKKDEIEKWLDGFNLCLNRSKSERKYYVFKHKENTGLKQQINEQQPNTSFNLSINAVVSSSLEAENMIKDTIEIQKEYSCNCTLNLKMFNL